MNAVTERYLEKLKAVEQTKEFPFDLISKKVYLLLMFHNTINAKPSGLEKSYKEVIDKAGIKDYAPMLLDYALLEIRDFYKKAWLKFKESITYPKTHEKVQVFRDNVVGHLKEDVDLLDLLKEYSKINAEGGFQEIYNEWTIFRSMLFEKINAEKVS
ncbi:MAG: hypothetical protein NTZ73_01560 [Candidatus Diapherotrites archaeon]|nr:hypothetical protein [Candidatus Diapherotrites archaeon]